MPAPRPRQVAVVAQERCDACGLCLPVCPPGAIRLFSTGLAIDAPTCTGCVKCIAPCPVRALAMVDASR